jgi:hypothetical protein
MTTITRDENEQYQLNDIYKYKIYISNMISKFITHGSHIEYEKCFNNLYNCHNLLFKNDENDMWYPTRSMKQSEVKQQEFTIHHFIYYLIAEAVKIMKRQSKRFTEYEVYELIEHNMFNAYELHLNHLFDEMYNYLYPTHNEKILSFVLILKNIFNSANLTRMSSWLSVYSIEYTDFGNWTKEDLMYNLSIRIDNHDDDDFQHGNLYVTDCLYQEIILCIEEYNLFTFQDVVSFIDFYKQTVAKERLQKYEAELIEKTWHPNRLMYWCFDIEDKNDFENETE